MRLLKGLFSLVFSLVCLALGAQIQVGDTLRVAVFADMHVSPGTVADENLAQAIENVNKSGYDFVIVAGDVSNVGSDAELQNVYDKLKALQVPYFFVPGNHETNWSESACKTIIDLWKNDRFVVEAGDYIFNEFDPIEYNGVEYYLLFNINQSTFLRKEVIEKIEVYFTLHRKYYLKLRQALVTDFSKQGLDLYGAH